MSGRPSFPTVNSSIGRSSLAGSFEVQHVKQHHRPEHAYVAVQFRDYWFYIDDRDHNSKMAFNQVYHLRGWTLQFPGPDSSERDPC